MKVIQVSVAEELLERLDADEEVANRGRSAVIREAVDAWLRRRRERRIVEAYRRAYGDEGGLGEDWAGWEDQGQWLDE